MSSYSYRLPLIANGNNQHRQKQTSLPPLDLMCFLRIKILQPLCHKNGNTSISNNKQRSPDLLEADASIKPCICFVVHSSILASFLRNHNIYIDSKQTSFPPVLLGKAVCLTSDMYDFGKLEFDSNLPGSYINKRKYLVKIQDRSVSDILQQIIHSFPRNLKWPAPSFRERPGSQFLPSSIESLHSLLTLQDNRPS